MSGLLAVGMLLPMLATAGGQSMGVGARFHSAHSEFTELPFDDDDMSYGVALEIHDGGAYWQVAVDYADDLGVPTIDSIITPQVTLFVEDGPWRFGVGGLNSYISDDVNGDEWLDIYWQMILGLKFPFFMGSLDVQAAHIYEGWDEIEEFEFDELDYIVWWMFEF